MKAILELQIKMTGVCEMDSIQNLNATPFGCDLQRLADSFSGKLSKYDIQTIFRLHPTCVVTAELTEPQTCHECPCFDPNARPKCQAGYFNDEEITAEYRHPACVRDWGKACQS